MGVGKFSVKVSRQFVFKICSDLEKFGKVRVINAEDVVEISFSQQNHLDVERNRFGFKRYSTDKAVELSKRFNPDMTGSKRFFECFVGKGFGQQPSCINEQVSSVCSVQRTLLDESEVRHQCAQLGDVFNVAYKILI